MKKIIIGSGILILLDQIIKFIIRNTVVSSISVIPHFFYITYVKNKGAAFGILSNQVILLIFVAVFLLGFLIYEVKKQKQESKLFMITYSLIIGGLIGNLIDRVVLGYVTDYLEFYLGSYAFPVFNLADMAIVIGVILLIIHEIRGEKNEVEDQR